MYLYIYRQSNQNARAQKYREADSTAATLASDDDPATDRLSECDDTPPQKKLAWSGQEEERE